METSEAPDLVGEIVGWRAWKVVGSEQFPLLASVTHAGTVWHPDRWTYATCRGDRLCHSPADRARGGRIPGEGCSCGLYAARDRKHLTELGYNRGELVVIGEVGLTGKVIPGSQGWKAEKGRIIRLYVPFQHWKWIEPLADLYGVPVQADHTHLAVPTFGAEGS